jgi:hypothetical protein
MAQKTKPFPTEADLCAAFIKEIARDDKEWTAYAETAGWDILLVHNADGRQIGIQAKLKLNLEVINQALEDGSWYRVADAHPDYRAVLVPGVSPPADKVCDHLGLTVIRVYTDGTRGHFFRPSLPTDAKNAYGCEDWHETATVKRHKLPEYVPDVAAGASSPLQLTDWKIKALKLTVTLELRGHLTRRDFAHHHVDHRRWITSGWLKIEDGRYIKDAFPDFKRQHPVVYKQIKADAPKWLPKTLFEPAPTQAALPLAAE